MNIYETINAVMKDVGVVAKTDTNTHQNFKFRGIDTIINALSLLMQKHGLVIMPNVIEESHDQIVIGQNQTKMMIVRVHVSYTFIGLEGDSIMASAAAEAMDSGDKATAKAMSVAYRTVLLQVFALASGDVDADSESHGHVTPLRAVPDAPATQETDAWTGEIVNQVPSCKHGEMVWKTGHNKEKNKDWGGYFCSLPPSGAGGGNEPKCGAIWYVIASDGTWKAQS